jgi:hypothetical protein
LARAGKAGDGAEPPSSEEGGLSVYAAYWQARSGLFDLSSRSPKSAAELVRNAR